MNNGKTYCPHGHVATFEPVPPSPYRAAGWVQPTAKDCRACKGDPCGIPVKHYGSAKEKNK